MDQLTQQNAAWVEQSTAAAHGLREESGAMTRAVRTFSLGDAPRAAVATPAPPRAPARIAPAAPGRSAPPNRALTQARQRIQAFAGGGAPAAATDEWREF